MDRRHLAAKAPARNGRGDPKAAPHEVDELVATGLFTGREKLRMEDGDMFRRAFEDGVLGFVWPPKDEFVSLDARDGRDPPTLRLPFVIPISGEDSVSDL
jgi:hypothetical protein